MDRRDNKKEDLQKDTDISYNSASSLNEVLSLKKRLLEYEIKYNSLLRVIPDTLYRIDPNGYFTFTGDCFCTLGYQPQELLGSHFSEIVHPEDLPLVSRSMVLPKYKGEKTGHEDSPKLFDERRSGSRITKSLELRLLPKGWRDKKNSDVVIASIFSCGEAGKNPNLDEKRENDKNIFFGTVGIIKDITEKKKYEDNFQKIQGLKSLGILAGGIAHDFNNILTAILGNVTLAKLEAGRDTGVYHALTGVEKASLRAKDLTNQLLTFTKGGMLSKKPASLSKFIMEMVEFTLCGSNIKCTFSFPEGLWAAEIDEGQISQVINNLIINSIQAMPEGGCIEISGENLDFIEDDEAFPGRFVMISIRDWGIGIPKENIQRIFDPYFSTKEKGSGLGLATSHSIIKKHGGKLAVESDAGKGTVFRIYLPVSEKEIPEKEKVEIGTVAFKGKILLMDDDEEILKVTGNILENFGFKVTISSNGEEAIDQCRRELSETGGFDLIIMDLTIPGGLGGKDAIKSIKEIDPGIKSIVTSGYSNDQIMENYKKFGFDGVVSKPYNLEEFIKIISNVINILPGK